MTQSTRNIAIIAQVDHGKTTFVDKIIQECETLDSRKDTGDQTIKQYEKIWF